MHSQARDLVSLTTPNSLIRNHLFISLEIHEQYYIGIFLSVSALKTAFFLTENNNLFCSRNM